MKVVMAHMLQTEQQNEELSEGVFEWKMTRFLENAVGYRTSSLFKFGTHNVFLKINYNFLECSPVLSVRQLRHLKIDLCIAEYLGITFFRKGTYFKGGFISRNEDLYISAEGCIYFESYSFPVISCSETCILAMVGNMTTLVPGDILTFRLAWSDKKIRLDSLIEGRTSMNQIEGEIPRKSLEKLSKDFEDFFGSRTNTDYILMVGNQQFQVHRTVLSARSSVFADMFYLDTLEKRTGVVNISDVDEGIMSDVLHYVYTGQIRRLDAETAASLYVVAKKYDLTEMKDDCLDFLMRNLSMENFVDAINLAHGYNVSALENKVIQFIAENAEDLLENDAWKKFSRTNPSVGIKYLESALVIKHNTKI